MYAKGIATEIQNEFPLLHPSSGEKDMRTGKIDVKGTFDLNKRLSIQDAAPSSPVTGDLWWETDSNMMWSWNGTYWLSTHLNHWNIGTFGPLTGDSYYTSTFVNDCAYSQYDFWLEGLNGVFYLDTTNTSVNYWYAYIQKFGDVNVGNAVSSQGIPYTTYTFCRSPSQNVYVDSSATPNGIYAHLYKQGTPTTAYVILSAAWRYVHL
jgi:hypothetical protein